jgi:hypothetical protein
VAITCETVVALLSTSNDDNVFFVFELLPPAGVLAMEPQVQVATTAVSALPCRAITRCAHDSSILSGVVSERNPAVVVTARTTLARAVR